MNKVCGIYGRFFSNKVIRIPKIRPSISLGSRTYRTMATTCSSLSKWRHMCGLARTLASPLTPATQTARYSMKTDVSEVPRHDPERGDLVYLGTLSGVVRLVKAFSLSTSIMGIVMQPFLYKNMGDSMVLKVVLGGTVSFFIFLTPLLLHWVTKRYVSTVYYNAPTDTFTATTYSLFLKEKLHQFTASQVTVPEVPGLFTTLTIHNKTPLFLDANMFLNKEALLRLMRYDQPFDWEVQEQQEAGVPQEADVPQEQGDHKTK